jgi:hypothetical protein
MACMRPHAARGALSTHGLMRHEGLVLTAHGPSTLACSLASAGQAAERRARPGGGGGLLDLRLSRAERRGVSLSLAASSVFLTSCSRLGPRLGRLASQDALGRPLAHTETPSRIAPRTGGHVRRSRHGRFARRDPRQRPPHGSTLRHTRTHTHTHTHTHKTNRHTHTHRPRRHFAPPQAHDVSRHAPPTPHHACAPPHPPMQRSLDSPHRGCPCPLRRPLRYRAASGP